VWAFFIKRVVGIKELAGFSVLIFGVSFFGFLFSTHNEWARRVDAMTLMLGSCFGGFSIVYIMRGWLLYSGSVCLQFVCTLDIFGFLIRASICCI
jgi:hypothetical protein